MDEKKKCFIGIFLFVLALPFIFAAPAEPTNLGFQDNSDADYDEGEFSVTWESGGGETEIGYNVYIFSDEFFLMVAPNTSETSYQVNNPAEARYTFIVEALNASNFGTNVSDNVSITVDSTPPSLDVIGYVKGRPMKNTENLELNIFTSDSDSGVSGSVCIINIGEANTNVSVSGGWCNSSSISLSGASDGNETIYIQVNDVAGNLAFENSYEVWIDTSGPVLDFECIPSNVILDDEVTCNCTAVDSGAGVNESSIQFSENPSTSEEGTFTRTCTASDLLGNVNSETTSYSVYSGSLYQGDSTNYSENDSWIYTYSITENEFSKGYTQSLALKRRIEFQIDSETHYVGVLGLNEVNVILEIASTPIEKILGIGDDFKLDFSNDGFYDIQIIFNNLVNNNSANLTVKGIHESVSGEALGGEDETNLNFSVNETLLEEEQKEKLDRKKIFIFGGVFLFVVILFILIYFLTGKREKKEKKEDEGVDQEPTGIVGDTLEDSEEKQENSSLDASSESRAKMMEDQSSQSI